MRERGFAVNNEELDFGLRSIAAPIRTGSGSVAAAINLAVHASRFTLFYLVSYYAPAVVRTANEISRRLAFSLLSRRAHVQRQRRAENVLPFDYVECARSRRILASMHRPTRSTTGVRLSRRGFDRKSLGGVVDVR